VLAVIPMAYEPKPGRALEQIIAFSKGKRPRGRPGGRSTQSKDSEIWQCARELRIRDPDCEDWSAVKLSKHIHTMLIKKFGKDPVFGKIPTIGTIRNKITERRQQYRLLILKK
jgi:hypothetical protein